MIYLTLIKRGVWKLPKLNGGLGTFSIIALAGFCFEIVYHHHFCQHLKQSGWAPVLDDPIAISHLFNLNPTVFCCFSLQFFLVPATCCHIFVYFLPKFHLFDMFSPYFHLFHDFSSFFHHSSPYHSNREDLGFQECNHEAGTWKVAVSWPNPDENSAAPWRTLTDGDDIWSWTNGIWLIWLIYVNIWNNGILD